MVSVGRPADAAPPQIGYAYPAGGQRGTTFTVEVGGQSLGEVDGVRVTGEGVSAEVVEYVPPFSDEERGRTERFLRELVRRRWSAAAMEGAAKETPDKPPLPDHPWLRDLDAKGRTELDRLRTRLFNPKNQPNAQIREQVVIAVTVTDDAPLGDRELRLCSAEGLSNPLCFQVGALPEIRESDFGGGAAAPVVELPVLLNGQIAPGEVDRVRLRCRRGQKLVVALHARRLIPYLADAVPGWFQAVMTLYDPAGAQAAWCDDYRFDPDPVLLYEVPNDGVYTLEIRDAIYRGRDDFVYRIAVGELPFVTQVFPLGGREGEGAITATINGWNLPEKSVRFDTRPAPAAIRHAAVGAEQGLLNNVRYAVDSLPETGEDEPNDTPGQAVALAFPMTVNGRIGKPGDVDVYRFDARGGQELVAEVQARRLNSPLDSVLRLTDSTGTELALNDDYKDREMGLLTHQADSQIRFKLPADGTYRIFVSDAQRQGGDAYAYRLLIRPAQPDFALRVVPSCLNVSAGGTARLTAHIVRKDGFDGEVEVELTDAPAGFGLSNARIPADKDSVEVTLKAPRDIARQVVAIRAEGRATIDGRTVSRPAVTAEDMMQAFLWRFLVPCSEWLVAVRGSRPVPAVWRPLAPGFRIAGEGRIRIPLGGTARVRLQAPRVLPNGTATILESVGYRLCGKARGVTLGDATADAGGVSLTLSADANMALPGDRAHLIVEAFAPAVGSPRGAPAAGVDDGGQVALGVLPPIAYEIVKP